MPVPGDVPAATSARFAKRLASVQHVSMKNPIRVEITARNAFWRNAVKVEWEHQYPDRKWMPEGERFVLIEAEWLVDLQRIAHQCFSTAVIAPEDVGRRRLFRQLFRQDDDAR